MLIFLICDFRLEIDECLSYPCLNNGTCNDFVDFYNCTCTKNYHGTICQYGKNIILIPPQYV
jgi:hypothetical protein